MTNDPTRTMGAGPASVSEGGAGGLKVSQALSDSWGPKINVPDPMVTPAWDLYADGVPKLNAFQSTYGGQSFERTYSEAGADGAPVYIDPETGGQIDPVRQSVLVGQMLPPASTKISMGPQRNFLMEGSAAERADKVGYYNSLANSDSVWDKARGVTGRIFTNAGYDLLDAGIGLYTLATDANAQAQLGAKMAYAATHPVNTIYAASKEVESYVTNTSLSQMLEDGARAGVGAVVGGLGAGKVVTTTGSLGLQATAETARWLAPKVGEMAFNSIDRMGLVLRAVPEGPTIRDVRASGSFGPDAPYVIRYDPMVPGRPDPRFSIDSLGFKTPTSATSNGGLRSTGEFWREWVDLRPESISSSNRYLIDNFDRLKVSPRVDATWTKVFPEHANHMRDVLVHHHVDFGRYAIPVPGKTHVGSGGPWHLGK